MIVATVLLIHVPVCLVTKCNPILVSDELQKLWSYCETYFLVGHDGLYSDC